MIRALVLLITLDKLLCSTFYADERVLFPRFVWSHDHPYGCQHPFGCIYSCPYLPCTFPEKLLLDFRSIFLYYRSVEESRSRLITAAIGIQSAGLVGVPEADVMF